ncbi:MAG: helicase [Hyphomicrobiales bacterium]|nr:helicase [Hyphomicrobiales bacterium]MDE2113593.1 helicase [Hyphomicrobiales bacterium]
MNIPYRPQEPRSAPQKLVQNVTAVLGPTNTGKTYYAIERMLTHPSGMIGLPLRLLAREVYQRVVDRVGADAVALVTGEERIKPKAARYWICTVEAMPRDLDVAFVALDEIQLCADLDRGHIFTDRLLNRRGFAETLLLGASTMLERVLQLLPGVHILQRERLSTLTFAGERKIVRLPRRSVIVAFSAEEVYAIAEWIRRQKGGAAVVLGALSPRTRNAQIDMYQNGDVDYIVATDAIGMGLNLDVDHVAFAGDRKFDGWHYRRLHPAEIGQIAGRAGRHTRDGTFGTTGRCSAFDAELVERLERHQFEPVGPLQWRSTDLDFTSIANLQKSLDTLPKYAGLSRSPIATDQLVLECASRDAEICRIAATKADIARLWDACQIPDYRKLSPSAHADLALSIYRFIVRAGKIPDDWIAAQIQPLDRNDGEIEALSARISHIRTWSFVANRSDWLKNPEHWQGMARQIEDSLSDALHIKLAQRFVDRRTSFLTRRLRENEMLEAEITAMGDVLVEGQHVGTLHGFRFTADPLASGEAAKTLNTVAQKVLAIEIEARALRVHEAVDTAFVLANDGIIRWLGEAVGKIAAGDHILKPRVQVLSDETLTGSGLEQVQRRLDLWLGQHVTKLLGALVELENNTAIEGAARGIAFQVAEALGVLERSRVAESLKTLDPEGRAALRGLGVRFGAFHLYLPLLLKPAPRALAAQLWALKNDKASELKGAEDVPHLASSGRTSFAADPEVNKGFYRAAGFKVCGERAVRVDILERLADLIRPAIAYRPGTTPGAPPPGAADGDGFVVIVPMTSLVGCSGEAFASILRSLGYTSQSRTGPAITVPLVPEAARAPVKASAPASITETETVATADGDAAEAAPPVTDAPDGPETEVKVAAEPSTPEVEPAAQTAQTEPETVAVEAVAVEAEPPVAEAAVAEEPVADTSAAEASAAVPEVAAATIEAVVEAVQIETWHPHRHHHNQQRPRSHKGPKSDGPNRRAGGAVANGEAAGGAAEGETPKPRHKPNRKPVPDKPQFSTVPDPELIRLAQERLAATESRRAPPAERPQNARPNSGRPQGDRAQNGRTHMGGPRKDGPPRTGKSGDAHFASSQKPAPRDRQPDPDSPFAKLLALKAQLENKGK